MQADLFYFLIQESSSRGEGSDWENPFECSNKLICAGITISEDAITDARNRLKQLGMIDFTPGERNKKSPVYEILYPFRTGNTAGKVVGNNPGNLAGNNPNLIQRINETETEQNETSASSEAGTASKNSSAQKKAAKPSTPRPPSPPKLAPEQKASAAWQELACPFTEAFRAEWLALCSTGKWKRKEQTAVTASLQSLMVYPEGFALELVKAAKAGGWQGVVFADTPDDFEKWKKRQHEHTKKSAGANGDGTGHRPFGAL